MVEENEEEVPGLSTEDLEKIQNCVDGFLKDQIFDETKADQLINDILESVMEILYEIKKPYKYMADLMLSHRVGACLTNYTSAKYDKKVDNIYYIFYPKDKIVGGKERPLIFALLTIFIVSYTKI